MRHMVVIVPELTGYASIRHVAVTLPYAAELIGEKYMLPGDVSRRKAGPSDAGSGRHARRLRTWSSGRRNATAPSNSASD